MLVLQVEIWSERADIGRTLLHNVILPYDGRADSLVSALGR